MERLGTHIEQAFEGLTGRHLSELTAEELREDLTQRREQAWHAACQLGRCRYALLPQKPSDEPSWVDSTTTCGGYHAVAYVEVRENGPPMRYWRWRPCVRHLAWAKAKAALKAGERTKHQRSMESQKPRNDPPDGWREGSK